MENGPGNLTQIDQYSLSEWFVCIKKYFLANNWEESCIHTVKLQKFFSDLNFCLLEWYWGSSCGDLREIQMLKVLEASRRNGWVEGGTPSDWWRIEVLVIRSNYVPAKSIKQRQYLCSPCYKAEQSLVCFWVTFFSPFFCWKQQHWSRVKWGSSGSGVFQGRPSRFLMVFEL